MGNDLELASTSVLIKVPPQPQDKLRGISCLLFAAINLLLPATSGSFQCASGPVPNRPVGERQQSPPALRATKVTLLRSRAR
jgi:hypothetical protein